MQWNIIKSKCSDFGIILPDDLFKKLNEYVNLIESNNRIAGLLAQGEIKNIWERHILDSMSLLLFHHIEDNRKILDFGSGGGLPGIVLAILYPKCKFILAESMSKKATFLETALSRLNIRNAKVFTDRAEKLSEKFDSITIRATGPLTRTISQSLKLLEPKGEIALWAGKTFYDNLDYWNNFCSKRNAVIDFQPYPKNWMPQYKFGIAFIELA